MPISERIRGHRYREVEKNISLYAQYLPVGSSVLDIGAGDGLAARLIRDNLGVNVTCLDKKCDQFNSAGLDFVLANAETLPFRDESFHATLLFYTLHHCEHAYKVLEEAARVTRNHIIIIEEFYKSWLNKQLMRVYDQIVNYALCPGNEMETYFLNHDQLLEFIEGLNLHIQEEHVFKLEWYRPPHKKLFVLSK